jgi:hypothetical protein
MLLLATQASRQWLVSLICSDPSQASGGCHRSLQLLQLLEDHGWSCQPLDPPSPPARRWHTLRNGLLAAGRHGPIGPFGLDSLRSQGHVATSVAVLHSRFPHLTGVIQEGTGFGSLAAAAEWRCRGVRSVLVPANIESLAPNIGSWTHRGLDVAQRFSHERRWWAMADAIFTISFEEAWWLQLHGINAEWLPYYPPSQREKHLLAIRKERKPDPAVGWLWLADFRNPANQAGVPLTLQWLQQCSIPPERLQVVGHGCDWLQLNYGDELPKYASIMGAIGDQQLSSIFRSCTAQIIVHPCTSGMLTRVVDAGLAGINIVGNTMAKKSYAHLFVENSVSLPAKPTSQNSLFLAALE